MELDDAHCHYQEPELRPAWPQILAVLEAMPIRTAVVNGTCEADWPRVAELAAQYPFVRPSFGLHPWYVANRSPVWLEILAEHLANHPKSGVGEFGLDRCVKNHDVSEQLKVFRPQLQLAAKLNRVASIHCIQAWGLLLEELLAAVLPARGFLIHAYGGPAEMVPAFVKLGAYFSFSPYFLHDRKSAQRQAFANMPLERLLIETDAPALFPPPECNAHPLTDPETGATINHPGNLTVSLAGLAEARGLPTHELAVILRRNFDHLWLSKTGD
jgi:TatD DNase family protein